MNLIRHEKVPAVLAALSVFFFFEFLPVDAEAQTTASFGSGPDVPGPVNARAMAVSAGCDKMYVLGGLGNYQGVLLFNYTSNAWSTVATSIPTVFMKGGLSSKSGIIRIFITRLLESTSRKETAHGKILHRNGHSQQEDNVCSHG